VITETEVASWAERFGVTSEQIRRDHFVSHVIHALTAVTPDAHFFGGTALSRTLLEGSRLSEDIDLLDDDAGATLESLRSQMGRALRREFPNAAWTDPFADGDGYSAMFEATGINPIKVYVGRLGPDARAWSFEMTDVELRYSDLPPRAVLTCPTPSTFAAMKLAAWFDRHAPRDLYDLAGLARIGVLADPEVATSFRSKMGVSLHAAEFVRAPRSTVQAWTTELAAQVRSLPSVDDCLAVVHAALTRGRDGRDDVTA